MDDKTLYFGAPWGGSVKAITSIILLLVAYSMVRCPDPAFAGFLIILLVFAFLRSVRGYSIENHRLKIHRPLFSTYFDLTKLKRTEVSPNVTGKAIGFFGIWGLFGSCGFCYNRKFGVFRFYGTNIENTVLLEFENKKVVVTPDDPKKFVEALA